MGVHIEGKEALQLAIAAGNWFFIVCGWVVVHLTSVRRAARLEKMAKASRLTTRVVEIRAEAVQFFTRGHDDQDRQTLKANLKFGLRALSAEVASTFDLAKTLEAEKTAERRLIRSSLQAFRKSITENEYFDWTVQKKVLGPSTEVVQAVWTTSLSLVQAIDKAADVETR